jgi:hypothetical protein
MVMPELAPDWKPKALQPVVKLTAERVKPAWAKLTLYPTPVMAEVDALDMVILAFTTWPTAAVLVSTETETLALALATGVTVVLSVEVPLLPPPQAAKTAQAKPTTEALRID